MRHKTMHRTPNTELLLLEKTANKFGLVCSARTRLSNCFREGSLTINRLIVRIIYTRMLDLY